MTSIKRIVSGRIEKVNVRQSQLPILEHITIPVSFLKDFRRQTRQSRLGKEYHYQVQERNATRQLATSRVSYSL